MTATDITAATTITEVWKALGGDPRAAHETPAHPAGTLSRQGLVLQPPPEQLSKPPQSSSPVLHG